MIVDTKTTKPNIPNGPTYPPGVGPLGVDLSDLADLPNDLRGRIIAALEEAAAALSSGDEARQTAATTRVTELVGEVQDFKNGRDVHKFFANMHGATKRGDVMRKFATRAGYKG